ncbi:MFS transporter [SAR202 cluster bacterium AD-493-K16_JPT_193m]|nr:MFS transporter [SAR202 cluster bacterium AD-493-K16_JPT_193m]
MILVELLDIMETVLLKIIKRTPFFYGWVIVAGAFFGAFASGGIQGFTFSVFLKPMSDDLGWTRSALTAGIAINTLIASFIAPVFGFIVDKYGPRPIMAAAALVGGVAAGLLSNVTELWQFYVIFAVAGIFGGAALGEVVTQSTVVKWFIRLRGRAVAIGSMGGAASGAVLAPVITFMVATSGWRSGWVLMAVIFFVVLLPISLLMVRSPEDVGLTPDGDRREVDNQNRLHDEVSWNLKEALRDKTLWFLTAALTVAGLCVSSVVVHEFSLITDRGFSSATAAAVLSTHAVMASAGRLIWGFLVEKVKVRYAMSSVFLLCGLSVIMLVTVEYSALLFVFAVIYGLSIGGYSVTTAVAFANYYGRANVGSIRGAVSPLITGSVAVGPVLIAAGYDLQGNYTMGFFTLALLYLIASGLTLLATPPQRTTITTSV